MRLDVRKTYKMYINGQFERSESGRYYTVSNKNNVVIANMCRASRKDVRNAVVAARKAQPSWSSKTAYNRGQILYRMAEMLESRKDQFINQLLLDGYSKQRAIKEVEQSVDLLVYYAGWSDKYIQLFSSVNPVAASYFNFSIPEPTGLVSVLPPEKKPLLDLVSFIAPVLCGGNTCIVLIPQEFPFAALTFSEILETSDVPPGVVNLLTGFRHELMDPLTNHMDINALLIEYTQSEEIIRVMENASNNVKRIKLMSPDDLVLAKKGNPYLILDFQEIKTTWHPIGI